MQTPKPKKAFQLTAKRTMIAIFKLWKIPTINSTKEKKISIKLKAIRNVIEMIIRWHLWKANNLIFIRKIQLFIIWILYCCSFYRYMVSDEIRLLFSVILFKSFNISSIYIFLMRMCKIVCHFRFSKNLNSPKMVHPIMSRNSKKVVCSTFDFLGERGKSVHIRHFFFNFI